MKIYELMALLGKLPASKEIMIDIEDVDVLLDINGISEEENEIRIQAENIND